jgi:hypothetical protein
MRHPRPSGLGWPECSGDLRLVFKDRSITRTPEHPLITLLSRPASRGAGMLGTGVIPQFDVIYSWLHPSHRAGKG